MAAPIVPPEYSSLWGGPGAIGRFVGGPKNPEPPKLGAEEWADMFMNPYYANQVAKYQMGANGPYQTPGLLYDDEEVQRYQVNEDGTVNPLEDWDYKNPELNEDGVPLNHVGDPLPEGAQAWDANGDPYWGEGLANWFEGFKYRAFEEGARELSPEEEAELAQFNPSTPLVQQALGLLNIDISDREGANKDFDIDEASGAELLSGMWNTITRPFVTGWRKTAIDDDGDLNVFGRASKVLGESIWGGLQGLGWFTQAFKRTAGTVAMSWKDLAGDRAADLGHWQVRSANFNWVYDMTLGGTWNALMTVFNAPSYSEVKDTFQRNWEASRIAYSTFEDATIKEEFINRMKAGEDPGLLAKELVNPWTELWGEVVLDPLNLLGPIAKSRKLTNRIETGSELMARAAGNHAELLDARRISEVPKAERASYVAQFVQEQLRLQGKVAESLRETARKVGLLTLTSDGKRYVYSQQMAEATKWLYANHTRDIDEPFEIMKHLANLHSSDEEKVAQAMRVVLDSRSPNVLLSEGFQSFGRILHDTLLDESGVMNAKKFLSQLSRKADEGLEAFLEYATKKYSQTLDDYFPSLAERADAVKRLDEINTGVRALEEGESLARIKRAADLGAVNPLYARLSKFDNLVKSNIYRPINTFYAHVYMGLSPGYAFRNLFSNTMHVFLDEGVGAWAARAADGNQWDTMWMSKSWIQHTENWLGGVAPQGMFEAIGKHQFAEGVNIKENSKWRWFLDVANNFEVGASRRVVGSAVHKTMNKMLVRGKALPDGTNLLRHGFSDDALRHIESLVRQNFGDVETAVRQFLDTTTEGVATIRVRDSLDFLDPNDMKIVSAWTQEQNIAKIAQAETKEDALRMLDEWHEQNFESVARQANEEVPPIPEDMKQFEQYATTVRSALDEGHLAEEGGYIYNATVIANQRAHDTSRELWTRVFEEAQKAIDPRNRNLSAEEFYKFMDEWGINSSGNHIEVHWADATQRARMLTDQTWTLSDKLKNLRPGSKTYQDDLRRIWESVKTGADDVPAEWSHRWIKNYLWDVSWPRKSNSIMMNGLGKHKTLTDEYLTAVDQFMGGALRKNEGVATLIQNAEAANVRAQNFMDAVYERGIGWRKLRDVAYDAYQKGDFKTSIRAMAARYGVGSASKSGAVYDDHILNVINKQLREVAERTGDEAAKYLNLDDLNDEEGWDLARQMFDEWGNTTGFSDIELAGASKMPADDAVRTPMAAPMAEGIAPSPAQVVYHQIDDLREMRDNIARRLDEVWDDTYNVIVDDNMKAGLDEYVRVAKDRIGEARAIAAQVGNAARDFTLLNYQKKVGLDLAASYVYPYHFLYTRTYKHWMQGRIAQNAGVLAGYNQYREAMETINAGAPDWWRYNLAIDPPGTGTFLGLDLDNPLFFNLEATLNPLNGLTGIDFEDPEKRVGMWTKILDDLGKFGPSTWTPLSIVTALGLYMRNEENDRDAAARFFGRMVPQTATFRAGASAIGGWDVEIDPFIQVFSGGYESYERGRIGRALATLVDQGIVTEEQAIDAARVQEGEAWDQAVQVALGQRNLGQMMSYFMGVGFKGRTTTDMAIDVFYQDYRKLWAMEGNMSPEQFREEMDNMRLKYPFMDTLLLARKSGLEQDRALAYNVLGRIPPGMTSDIAELVGIPSDVLSNFYDDKGHIEDWAETDRDRFMSAIIDVGAVLAMPQGATRREWTAVRNSYSSMQDQGAELFGEAWSQMDMFFAAGSIVDEDQRNAFRDSLRAAYPSLDAALDWRSEQILNNPLLYDYYGGIEFYEQYHRGQVYTELEERFGADIGDKWSRYWELKAQDDRAVQELRVAGESTRGYTYLAREYWDEHPELEQWIEVRDARFANLDTKMNHIADYLKAEGEDTISVREDIQDTGYYQQQLQQAVAPQVVPWGQYEQILGSNATQLLLDFFIDGEEMPPVLVNELTALAQTMQVSIGQLLAQMQTSFQQELQVQSPVQP